MTLLLCTQPYPAWLHGHSPVSQALLGTFFTWGLDGGRGGLVLFVSLADR